MQSLELDALDETIRHARGTLLESRTPLGHWEGELSSSALSTATAVFALSMYWATDGRARLGSTELTEVLPSRAEAANGQPGSAGASPSQNSNEQGADAATSLISGGVAWLVAHQNPDGGWGDTVKSLSNISTTALCWAALGASPTRAGHQPTIARAEAWLTSQAGGVDPDHLIPAIIKRYGKDHTFSVPILTMCALAGRLGVGRDAWRRIPQLPFELAAFPQRWFKWLKLPVVSYALPALIAIGLVRHRHRPSRNPLALFARRLARSRALRLLQRIQPTTGGYLEATPLTSFVVMSLVGAGLVDHPVVSRGIEFLVRSARPDGSWAIDTNLATWVTTLAVNALSIDPEFQTIMPEAERRTIRDWLLDQQNAVEHPYTLADRGGWAWTNLNGGVPDADDTAGALLALHRLGIVDERTARAAAMGARWLMNLQNRDCGIPTFCKGWGRLPFDRSSFDLTAHALRAWHASSNDVPASFRDRVLRALYRPTKYLVANQRGDGAWVPLWFGNQHAGEDQNPTYGTAKVLCAAECFRPNSRDWIDPALARGVNWLLRAQNPDGGWGGDVGAPSTIEETALAVEGLAIASCTLFDPERVDPWDSPKTAPAVSSGATRPGSDPFEVEQSACTDAIRGGVEWLVEHTDRGRQFPPSPIGFYFAKLWYFEKLYPVIFTVSALNAVKRYIRATDACREISRPSKML